MKKSCLWYVICGIFIWMPFSALRAQVDFPGLERRHKVYYFAERNDNLTQEQFNDRMVKEMPEFFRQISGLDGLVFNLASPGQGETPYDLIIEMWFANEAAYQSVLNTAEGKRAYKNLEQLLAGKGAFLPVTPSRMIQPPISGEGYQKGYKRLFWAFHTPEITLKECQYIHLRDYAPVGIGIPAMRGYIINYAIKETDSMPAHVVVPIWFDTEESFLSGMQSSNVEITKEMGAMLFGDSLKSIEVKEYVVQQPPHFLFEIEAQK